MKNWRRHEQKWPLTQRLDQTLMPFMMQPADLWYTVCVKQLNYWSDFTVTAPEECLRPWNISQTNRGTVYVGFISHSILSLRVIPLSHDTLLIRFKMARITCTTTFLHLYVLYFFYCAHNALQLCFDPLFIKWRIQLLLKCYFSWSWMQSSTNSP